MISATSTEPKQGAFAQHLLSVLSHDVSLSLAGANEKTLESVLAQFGAKDGAGGYDWDKTAQSLVRSLNDLAPGTLAVEAQGRITELFAEFGKTEKTPKDMAAKLLKANFSKDETKAESMFEFLMRHGQDAGGLQYRNDGTFLGEVDGMLRGVDGNLANMFSAFAAGSNMFGGPEDNGGALELLSLGWNVAANGFPSDVAELHGYPEKDGDGKRIEYYYAGPGYAQEGFFEGVGVYAKELDLGGGARALPGSGFKDVVFQAWVDKGAVTLSDKHPDAEGKAILLAKQLMLGGQIGDEFVDGLTKDVQLENGVVRRAVLQFGGMSEADIQSFKDGLSAHMSEIKMNRSGSSLEAANEVVLYVRGVQEQYPGVHFRGVENGPAAELGLLQRGKDPLNVYSVIRNEMRETLEPYRKASNAADFAERFQKYANAIPGLHVGFDKPAVAPSSTELDVDGYVAGNKELELAHVKYEAPTTQGGGAPSVQQGERDQVLIGNVPAPAYYNECAVGANAVQCKPDGPDVRVEPLVDLEKAPDELVVRAAIIPAAIGSVS